MDRFSKYQCLVTLAQAESYSTAAHELGISQPALTRNIQALEQSIGARLLDRSSRGVTLTPVGEVVVSRARDILRELDDLEHEIERARGAEIEHLAIGGGPYPSAFLLPPVLARIAAGHPHLQVRFEMETWRLLLPRLKQRKLDLVVAEASEAETDLELDVTLLRPRPGLLLVRRGHPLTEGKVDARRLASFPFATTSLPHRALASLQGAFGIHWRPAIQCDDVRLLTALVRRTDVVTIGVQDMLEQDDDLQVLTFGEAPVETRVGIIRLAHRTPPPVAQDLFDLLIEADRR